MTSACTGRREQNVEGCGTKSKLSEIISGVTNSNKTKCLYSGAYWQMEWWLITHYITNCVTMVNEYNSITTD